MDHIIFGCQWKATSDDPGSLEGYMSVFGNVDQGGDIVKPGAFRKTFADWSRAKSPMPLIADHQLSTDGVIGSVTKMAEDGKGAKVQARFSGVSKAQEIRQKMLEGHLSGMSFTYRPVKYSFGEVEGKQVRYLEEVQVFEATVTPFPMNREAMASAKGNLAGVDKVTVGRAIEDARKAYTGNTGMDFETFTASMEHLLALPVSPLREQYIDTLVKHYHPAAGTADEPSTATVTAGTEQAAAITATEGSYALGFVKYSEPHDGALDPVATLEVARSAAEMERLEAEITDALGGTP